jgi:hypothetical protein
MRNSEPESLLAYVDGKYLRPTRAMLDLAGAADVEVLIDDQHSTLLVSNAQGCLLRINGIRGQLQFRDLYGSREWSPRLERGESRLAYVSPEELRRELQKVRNAETAPQPLRQP